MTCSSAKQTWDILEMTHSGTSTVKRYNLQLLTSQFENFDAPKTKSIALKSSHSKSKMEEELTSESEDEEEITSLIKKYLKTF